MVNRREDGIYILAQAARGRESRWGRAKRPQERAGCDVLSIKLTFQEQGF
jgi:hypothetical protein